MDLQEITFPQALRHFFFSRRQMAREVGVSPTTLRHWEQQKTLERDQRARILGAALLERRIPLDWLAPYADNPHDGG
jgi:transcriptional regulator with XRE-family HTH domain